MAVTRTLNQFRDAIRQNVGKTVNLTLKRGRKYITLNECVIENAYEGIFVLKIPGESLVKCKTLSVCYADLLTGSARITLINNSKGA